MSSSIVFKISHPCVFCLVVSIALCFQAKVVSAVEPMIAAIAQVSSPLQESLTKVTERIGVKRQETATELKLSINPDGAGASGDVLISGSKSSPKIKDTEEVIIITLVGDTGYSPTRSRVRPSGVTWRGRHLKWAETTAAIEKEINGDINFANIETVVTDRNGLAAIPKQFNFRTHPNGLRHLVKSGFNLFSVANNHAYDYGTQGVLETLKHMDAARDIGLIAHAGLGHTKLEAETPKLLKLKGSRMAFSAMGIGASGFVRARASASRAGQINIRDAQSYRAVVDKLANEKVDYRILSMHYGTELAVNPSRAQIRKWRYKTLKAKGIDLIIGHHAHVVQGVEYTGGRLIFYGLGNFLHPGMQNMAKFDRCRDYGLMARVYLTKSGLGHLSVAAIEVIPLTDMHFKVRPMPVLEAHRRIAILNVLAERLDDRDSDARGVRFMPRPDGTGLSCARGASIAPEPIASLCRGVVPEMGQSVANISGGGVSCGKAVARRRGHRSLTGSPSKNGKQSRRRVRSSKNAQYSRRTSIGGGRSIGF